MINLPADALAVLEKVVGAEGDFIALFKGLAIGGSGIIIAPPRDMTPIHTSLLLHIIANLVEARAEIKQLQGQLAVLTVDYATAHNRKGGK